MSDDKTPEESRTLADYIPPEPKTQPRSSRREPTRAEVDRLEALERAVRDTDPDAPRKGRRSKRDRSERDLDDYYANKGWKKKGKRGSGKGSFIFWALVILFVVAFVLD